MTEKNNSKEWYAIYTLPRAEKKLSNTLKKYKFNHYLPLLKIKKKWSDRFKFVDTPLFSSYIFVCIDYFSEKNKILTLPGAHHFIFHLGKPCIIPNEDIEMIKIFVENFPETLQLRKEENLKKGKMVLIKYGSFKGHRAEVQKIKNKAIVSLKILGMNQVLSVEVKIDDLGLDEL